jgi:hypothetical protein
MPGLAWGLVRWAGRLRAVFTGSGDHGSPAGGPGGRGFHGPRGAPSLIAGTVWRWSGSLRQGADLVPGGHDVGGPGPAGVDLEAAPAAAAGQPGGSVQDAVTGRKVFGSALARRPSRASSRSQASKVAAVRAAASQALFIAIEVDGELADAAVLAGADGVLDPGIRTPDIAAC